MPPIQKVEVEAGMKCNADKFYNLFKNNIYELPKIFPETYKSIELVEGDGKSAGSIRRWKYVIPGTSNTAVVKEKTDVDERNKSITVRVIEGDVLKAYKSFETKYTVSSKGNGSTVKCCLQFEKENENVPTPTGYEDVTIKLFQKIDAYLLKA